MLLPSPPPYGHPYQGQQHHRAPPQAVRDGSRERCCEELQDGEDRANQTWKTEVMVTTPHAQSPRVWSHWPCTPRPWT